MTTIYWNYDACERGGEEFSEDIGKKKPPRFFEVAFLNVLVDLIS